VSYKGFTWNIGPASAELLLQLLLAIEAGDSYRVDRHMASLYIEDLLIYLEVAPDGTTSATHGPNATKKARLDGYRDLRRRLR